MIHLIKRITLGLNKQLKWRKAPFQAQRGIGLAEVLVALAIIGSAITALIASMSTGASAVDLTDERVTARGLAESQLEYIKSYPFAPGTTSYPLVNLPTGRGFTMTVQVGTPTSAALSGTKTTFLGTALPNSEASVQEISITVSRDGQEVIELTTFKGNR